MVSALCISSHVATTLLKKLVHLIHTVLFCSAVFILTLAIRMTVVPIRILIRTTVVPIRILIRTTGITNALCFKVHNYGYRSHRRISIDLFD